MVLEILSDTMGMFPDEVHEFLKWKFLRKSVGKYETTRSTTSLTTAEFEDYLSKVRMWANMELQCWIPEPNEEEVWIKSHN